MHIMLKSCYFRRFEECTLQAEFVLRFLLLFETGDSSGTDRYFVLIRVLPCIIENLRRPILLALYIMSHLEIIQTSLLSVSRTCQLHFCFFLSVSYHGYICIHFCVGTIKSGIL
jgi:hypothetical protein